ncbi:MAG TPA: hypothetical protein VGH28_09530 [Polyangiaceae bacterium]
MKTVLFLSIAVLAACSQADKHPTMLGDCDVCTPVIGGGTGGGGDSGVDASGDDGAASDAGSDVDLADVIDLDGPSE